MENIINIAELLKDCPKGMELDCPMFENVTLCRVDNNERAIYPITVLRGDGNSMILTKYGQCSDTNSAKCVIFPKGKTTWEGFVPPCKFKNGDIVVTKASNNFIYYSIYKGVENREVLTYVDYNLDCNKLMFDDNLSSLCFIDEIVEQRLATEEEKKKLFQAIKDNSYKWNEETKTLEKLPKFKVGDRIVKRNGISVPVLITGIGGNYYYSNTENSIEVLPFAEQDDWELVPNKFDINTLKPFESKVLVRDIKSDNWIGAFYSHYKSKKFHIIGGPYYYQCIPYKGNEHLLGTTDDCDEYYKNW